LGFQGASHGSGANSQIASKDNSQLSHKSDVIAVPTVENDIKLESTEDSGCKSPDTAITRPIEPSHSKFEPGVVATRSERVIKPQIVFMP